MSKMGRPKSENPKNTQITVRFSSEDLKQLDTLADRYNMTRVEVIRKGIKTLLETKK